MNPRMNGKFRDLKSCLCELLGPEGELATAAGAFDVIAFCNEAWSWSSTYASKQDLLMSSRAMHSGRQAGRLPSKPLGAGGCSVSGKRGEQGAKLGLRGLYWGYGGGEALGAPGGAAAAQANGSMSGMGGLHWGVENSRGVEAGRGWAWVLGAAV